MPPGEGCGGTCVPVPVRVGALHRGLRRRPFRGDLGKAVCVAPRAAREDHVHPPSSGNDGGDGPEPLRRPQDVGGLYHEFDDGPSGRASRSGTTTTTDGRTSSSSTRRGTTGCSGTWAIGSSRTSLKRRGSPGPPTRGARASRSWTSTTTGCSTSMSAGSRPEPLYINQGDGTFKEMAHAYGLDIKDCLQHGGLLRL